MSSIVGTVSQVALDPFFQIAVVMILIGIVAERFLPAVEAPEGYSIKLNLIYGLILAPLNIFFFWGMQAYLASTAVSLIGLKNIFNLQFDTSNSIALSLLAVIVSTAIVDLFYYGFHRAQHTFEFLWQSHVLHHSDEHLNVTTVQRAHFSESFFSPFLSSVPMTILFNLPTPSVIALAYLPAVYVYVIHSNLRVGFGPLWWLLGSPQYHRIHHSIELKHYNKNFAVHFPIWDVVFGTAYRPAAGEYPHTGVEGDRIIDLSDAIFHPFVRWAGMLSPIMLRVRKLLHARNR